MANGEGSQESTVHPHLDCFFVQGHNSPSSHAAYYEYGDLTKAVSEDAFDILSALTNYFDFWSKGDSIPPTACDQTILPEGD